MVVLENESNPPICMVSIYMPCRGNSTKLQYEATLDELQEIVLKFNSSHAVFICGDMNSSLSRTPPNDRDTLFREFCNKTNSSVHKTEPILSSIRVMNAQQRSTTF